MSPQEQGFSRQPLQTADEQSVQHLLLRLGEQLIRDGRDNEAGTALRRAITEGTTPEVTAAAHLALADVLLRGDQLRSGCAALVDALAADPLGPDEALDRIGYLLTDRTGDASGRTASTEAGQHLSRTLAEEIMNRSGALMKISSAAPMRIMHLLVEAAAAMRNDEELCRFLARSAEVDAVEAVRLAHDIVSRLNDAGALDPLAKARFLAAVVSDAEALDELEDALSGGEWSAERRQRALAYELRAQLLDRGGRLAEAVTAWFNAGQEWTSVPDFRAGLATFDKAKSVAMGNGLSQPTVLPFYRAECIRLQDLDDRAKYASLLRTALTAWDEGRNAEMIPAWALECRGLILEELAKFEDDGIGMIWDAALLYERALALSPSGAQTLARMAQAYWNLDQRAVAVWCVKASWAQDSDDEVVLNATAQVMANAKQFPPDGLVERLRGRSASDPWWAAISGVYARLVGDDDLAIRDLSRAIDDDPDLLWAYEFLIEILVRVGRWDDAMLLLQRWEQQSETAGAFRYPDRDKLIIGCRARLLQDKSLAIAERAEELVALVDDNDGNAEGLLAAAYAWSGDFPAFRTWVSRWKEKVTERGSSGLCEMREELALTARFLGHYRPTGDPAVDAFRAEEARVAQMAEEAALDDLGPAAAIRQLSITAAQTDSSSCLVASRMMLARILLDEGRDGEAGPLLQEMWDALPGGMVFPELDQAIASGFVTAAFSAANRRRPDEVAMYLARSADVASAAGRSDPSEAARTFVGSLSASDIGDAGTLVALSQGFSQFAQRSEWPLAERVKVSTARRAIHRKAYLGAYASLLEIRGADDSSLSDLPEQPRIVIEADRALFPEMADTPGVQWMLTEAIPAMRERLGVERVPLPGVRIRPASDLHDGQYRLYVLGSVVARGELRIGGRFVADGGASATSDSDATIGHGPDGRWGSWTVEDTTGSSHEDGLDPFAFVLAHLEANVRPRRSELLLRDDFLLEVGGAPPTSETSLTTDEAEGALAAARQLLALGLEPPSPRELATVVPRESLTDLVEAVAAIVSAAESSLAGVLLDGDIEMALGEWVTNIEGRTVVVAPAAAVGALVDSFSDWFDRVIPERGDAGRREVVTRDPRLLLAVAALARRAGRPCVVGWSRSDRGDGDVVAAEG